MISSVIDVRDLHFSYCDVEAVRGITFTVSRGEILGFLGPNGAGKSTTIKVLTGQLSPGSGSVSILGKALARDDPEIQSRIGVCFEEKNLYNNMSARENLKFFAGLFGMKGYNPDALLRRVSLIEKADDRVSGYSKGMRQRLMIARAMVNDPDVLFLDEPTEGLDPVSSRSIRELILEQAQKGTAVLLTTHNMREADELSDRVAFICEGRIHVLDTPDNLKLKYGHRTARVKISEDGTVRQETISLDKSDAGDKLKKLVEHEGLLTIHTEEATLEDIFIRITGRGL
ncbi:MAG: ABC transporter ATP-binding protein [Candidatus Sabulitectum sp.]|nr:ABC transporter ATP-binding protein [Candidatus Sabulitectum sp.]